MCGPYPRRLAPEGEEDGSYLVLGAVLLTALFLAAGVGVDLSRKFRLEQMTQDIADAAAVAAARALPDSVAARQVAIEYIRQHVGGPTIDTAAFYTPADSDIAVFVDPLTLTSGTVGVVVRANWDPIFIPNFLEGAQLMAIERYAIAVFSRGTSQETVEGTSESSDAGAYALFVGDTQPGACPGTLTAHINANNWDVTGDAHINHELAVNGNNITFTGTLETIGLDVNGGGFSATTTVDPADVIPMPAITESGLNVDVTLDINLPGMSAFYGGGSNQNLYAPGPNGIFEGGAGDDIPVMAEGVNVQVKYAGTDGYGHQQWEFHVPTGRRILGADNPLLGAGVDIKVVGDAKWNNNNNGLDGMLWTTGSLEINANNNEFHQTSDNPGLVIYTGEPGDSTKHSLLVNGNVSQHSYTGLIYVNGTAHFNGNASNNTQAIRGALWAKKLSSNCSGNINGNNWGILYDASLIAGVPMGEVLAPRQFGSAVVTMIE